MSLELPSLLRDVSGPAFTAVQASAIIHVKNIINHSMTYMIESYENE